MRPMTGWSGGGGGGDHRLPAHRMSGRSCSSTWASIRRLLRSTTVAVSCPARDPLAIGDVHPVHHAVERCGDGRALAVELGLVQRHLRGGDAGAGLGGRAPFSGRLPETIESGTTSSR